MFLTSQNVHSRKEVPVRCVLMKSVRQNILGPLFYIRGLEDSLLNPAL